MTENSTSDGGRNHRRALVEATLQGKAMQDLAELIADGDLLLVEEGVTGLLNAAAEQIKQLRASVSGAEPPSGIEGAVHDVLAFAEATGDHLVGNRDPHPPALVRRKSRLNLLREEMRELEDAVIDNDVGEVADAYADIIYIVLGSAIMHLGVERFCRVWREVQRSNMAKCVDGKIVMRDDGKILKPEGWTPPDIAGALRGPG